MAEPSLIEPEQQSTPFQRALRQYIESLPEKKRKRKFIVDCQRSLDGSISADDINKSIKEAEKQSSKQTSKRIVRNVLRPVVDVLTDFDDIIGQLASADPLPTALIWGALKVILNGFARYLNLFETIKNELRSLTSHLQRITEYELLYGHSATLQELLCQTYVNILRFWSRVDKECDRCCFNSLFRAATSFSTTKLSKIVDDIKGDADQIEKLAPIIEARQAKGERENAMMERLAAGLERHAAQKERQESAEWRGQQKSDREVELYHQVCRWLSSLQVNETNQRRHLANVAQRLDGTCVWLTSNETYIQWLNGKMRPAIIWIRAPPGCGKSTLCSHAIQSIQESNPKAAVAFHFYQFDHVHSAIEILRLLAIQLFEKYWNGSHQVADDMHLGTQKTSASIDNVRDLIKILVKSVPRVFFILDGVDEECRGARWNEARIVLDFLIQLSIDFPESVRLWYSSQDRPCIQEKLRAYGLLEIKDHVSNDVTYYLSHGVPELDVLEVPETQKARVMGILEARAEGNFLCASLMVEALAKETDTLNAMTQFVEEDLPGTLDGYYQRIFDRFEQPHRPLASKIFALIAFARRPLKMKEVREAIGVLQSSDPGSPDPGDLPFTRSLLKLFAPLIEVEHGYDDMEDYTCRLFHSTVRDFLLKNPDILSHAPGTDGLRISPYIIFNACLLYLSQARYQRLLVRNETRWVDSSGEYVERHHFLLYAAKYWDKHIDEISQTEILRTRVKIFLTSSNFMTCIQAQSLWVDNQFNIFYVTGEPETYSFMRRVFPSWFVGACVNDSKLWRDFRAFLHEWRYLLQCWSCDNPRCHALPYAGEVDRCFWGALGSNNFLSTQQERYKSFAFQSDEVANHSTSQCYDGISVLGDELRLLRLASRSQGKLTFTCEFWCLADNALPTLRRVQTLSTDETKTNWLLYVSYMGEQSNIRAGRANPVSFCSDCRLLRIGTEIFAEDTLGYYGSLFEPTAKRYPAYVEEFTGRGPYSVLSSRRVVSREEIYASGIRDSGISSFGEDFSMIEDDLSKLPQAATTHVNETAGDAGDYNDSDSSYITTAESSTQAEETWSEWSTDEEDVQFEDDLINPWTARMESMNSSSESSDIEANVIESSSEEADEKTQSSEAESDLLPTTVIGYGRYHRDSSSDAGGGGYYSLDDSDYEAAYTADAYAGHRKRKTRTERKASITVFDLSSSATPIFRLTRMLPVMLYGSPPVIHPSISLIVWPLSIGDVLFADFLAKTYFIRKLRPSTAHTRHIFMKCKFSVCGRYLHVASLEGQRKPASKQEHKKGLGTSQPPLKLALMVLTYRLSNSKPTKTPPSLISRTRIDLGETKALSVSKLPFTLTWTPEEVYITCSGSELRVYRVGLFRVKNPTRHDLDSSEVLVPRKTLFLPNTAQRREVYFFPPGVDSAARVIIGSETRARDSQSSAVDEKFFGLQTETGTCATAAVFGLEGMLAPPIGCYLKEADIGGWVKSHEVSDIPQDMGIGRLDRRMELFNPDNDCDLEPYIF